MKISKEDKLLLKSYWKTSLPSGIVYLDTDHVIDSEVEDYLKGYTSQLLFHKKIDLCNGESEVVISKKLINKINNMIDTLKGKEKYDAIKWFCLIKLTIIILNQYIK